MTEKRRRALETGEYFCPECGKLMVFETEWKDSLVCEHCGYDCRFDDYGLEEDEIENRNYDRIREIASFHEESHEEIYGEDD